LRITLTSRALVVGPRIRVRRTAPDAIKSEVTLKHICRVVRPSLQKVELLNPPFGIIALFGRKIETPLAPVYENGKRCTLMKRVFKKLTVARLAQNLVP
jgi:hypothetical protein